MDDAYHFLAHHPHFAVLDDVEVRDVAGRAATRHLARGEILALEGDPCEHVYLVMDGRIRAIKVSPQGREQVVRELRPPEAFYVVPALDDGRLPTTTQAATRAAVLALPKGAFLEVLERYPRVERELLVSFARRLRQLTTLTGELALYTVPERLARLLLQNAASPTRPRMTQQEMAAALGTVREVVARALYDFQDRGWLSVNRGRIEILDVEALRDLASR